jgi:catechol 2,3-dioxygenase-like lactoylglutathione lyase family enzyme
MPINSLNHINIRTDMMEETKDFFVDIVGLEIGARPPFDIPGYWLYAGDTAIVHLVPSEPDSPPRTDREGMGNGLDHIGLMATGADEMKAILARRGIKYYTNLVGGGQILQIFFEDPNGVLVEIGYDAKAEGVTAENYEPVTV